WEGACTEIVTRCGEGCKPEEALNHLIGKRLLVVEERRENRVQSKHKRDPRKVEVTHDILVEAIEQARGSRAELEAAAMERVASGSQKADSNDCKYWAFISYSSHDRKEAKWLHRALETYRIPSTLAGKIDPSGAPTSKYLRPIFFDRSELSASSDLSSWIRHAMMSSRYLIVLCSPSAAASHWVNEEIRFFKESGKYSQIFGVISDGVPYASDRENTVAGVTNELECFPPALRYGVPNGSGSIDWDQRSDPFAADLRHEGRRLTIMKLVAGILDVDFDTIYNRHERMRRRKNTLRLSAILFSIVLVFSIFASLTQKGKRATQHELAAIVAAQFVAGESDLAQQNFRKLLELDQRWNELNFREDQQLETVVANALNELTH
ncbi:toll/interleukin-1 receptor domain-containing protein, partial [Verrucomicrobiales bacterium]|nr:toll/interleukin-1 receptor domain-containing protein [Verrucomicrobiales bacterium]